MSFGGSHFAQVLPKAIAAIGAQEFHFQFVSLGEAGRPVLYGTQAFSGSAHHACHLRAGSGDTVIGVERYAESARIDGASEFRIFLRLILPLGLPAIASLAIFQFLWTWNDLLVALVFGGDTKPITVAIFTQLRSFSANIDIIGPAAFISLAIPLCVFFAFQRYFVQGLLAGSVK